MESNLAKIASYISEGNFKSERKRVFELFKVRAGDKAEELAGQALVIMDRDGKQLERALADVLTERKRK